MKESAIQKKILDYLEGREFFVIKTLNTNRTGVPDIICCAPDGRFVAIEVKVEGGILSKLQTIKLRNIAAANGIAAAVYGWEDFKTWFAETFPDLV